MVKYVEHKITYLLNALGNNNVRNTWQFPGVYLNEMEICFLRSYNAEIAIPMATIKLQFRGNTNICTYNC